MSRSTSVAAVVVPTPTLLPGFRLAAPAVAGSPLRAGGVRRGLGRARMVLAGFGEMILVAYGFALAILAVGIPVALFVRVVVEIGQALGRP